MAPRRAAARQRAARQAAVQQAAAHRRACPAAALATLPARKAAVPGQPAACSISTPMAAGVLICPRPAPSIHPWSSLRPRSGSALAPWAAASRSRRRLTPMTYGPPGYDPRLERPRGTPGYGEDSLPPLPSLLPQIHIPAAPAPLINPSAPPPDRDDQMRDKTPSEILGGNLEAAGVPRPPDTAAHHIVPYGDRRAQRIRDLLGSFNPPIDLNSAANGVFLPSRPGSTAPGAYHPSLHSDDYYDALRDDFRNVGTRDEAIEALDRIRDQLLDATYPGSKPVPPKE